jgi:hypothetical protein
MMAALDGDAPNKARYLAASGGLVDWEASQALFFVEHLPHPSRFVALFSLQGCPVSPAPTARVSPLEPKWMPVPSPPPVAHASQARGQRWRRLPNNAVAINERRGVIGAASNASPSNERRGESNRLALAA